MLDLDIRSAHVLTTVHVKYSVCKNLIHGERKPLCTKYTNIDTVRFDRGERGGEASHSQAAEPWPSSPLAADSTTSVWSRHDLPSCPIQSLAKLISILSESYPYGQVFSPN